MPRVDLWLSIYQGRLAFGHAQAALNAVRVVEVVGMMRRTLADATRVVAVAVILLCLPLLSGCAFLFGELVGVGAGATAGAVTQSPAGGAAGGAAAGAGGGALVGYFAGAPLAGAIGGGLSGAAVGYLSGRSQQQ